MEKSTHCFSRVGHVISGSGDLGHDKVGADPLRAGHDSAVIGSVAHLNSPNAARFALKENAVSRAQMVSAGIPCFTAGTLILTPNGEVPVERLDPGDRVMTRDNGLQPIVWIGRRSLGRKDLTSMPKLRPIQVAAGAFGNVRPILFSPQHGLLLRDKARGGGENFVRARHLARLKGGKVRVANGVHQTTYVHLMFQAHQVVMSGGLWSESFYPGPQAVASLRQPEVDELVQLFPALSQGSSSINYGKPARDFTPFRMLADHIQAHDPAIGGTGDFPLGK